MTRRVAVIAHRKKTLGGGLDELRHLLSREDLGDLHWFEVGKSRKAPKAVEHAIRTGADLLVVWGGDGLVQRVLDTVVRQDADVPVAIVPAGTANLLAHHLGVPADIAGAVEVAFRGRDRVLDLGRVNGEHFAVMAGTGFDADMIDAADGALKNRLGRMAYVWTGALAARRPPVRMRVKLDGVTWFEGKATCLLAGNVSELFGGITVLPGARPDDGWLDVGIMTAQGAARFSAALARVATGHPDRSPHIRITRGRRITVHLYRPQRYELDGGSRPKTGKIKIRIVPKAVRIRVPDVPSDPLSRRNR